VGGRLAGLGGAPDGEDDHRPDAGDAHRAGGERAPDAPQGRDLAHLGDGLLPRYDRHVLGRIVYWLAVLAISVALVVALIMFFESRDQSQVGGAVVPPRALTELIGPGPS
jgi:hypothetical protein